MNIATNSTGFKTGHIKKKKQTFKKSFGKKKKLCGPSSTHLWPNMALGQPGCASGEPESATH